MTQNLGRPRPLPYVDEEDLLEIAGEMEFGVFASAELYRWHCSLVEDAGREPVGRTKFGRALTEAGWKSSLDYRDGRMVRCWMIPKPWARRGAEFINKPKSGS